MKGYKAFKSGLICNPTGKKPFKFEENAVFEQNKEATICESGFHFCKSPLGVLDYYPLVDEDGEMSEFAEVEALDDVKTNDNKKYCTKKIKIGAKLSFAQLVQASVKFDFEKITKETIKNQESGDAAQIGSSGYAAKIGSSGDAAQIGSSGENSVICCAGKNCTVKAKVGSWITLSEWKWINGKYIPSCVKTEYVDGKRIKSDVFYKLIDGEFIEVE